MPPSYSEATQHHAFDPQFQSLETRFNQILTNIKSLLPPTVPVNQPSPVSLSAFITSPAPPNLAPIRPTSSDVPVTFSCVTPHRSSSMPPHQCINPSPPKAHLSDSRRQYLKRLFSSPDSESSQAQSYTYVYLPRSRPINRKEIRSIFRALSIDNHRILDITFPAKTAIGVLLHEAYLPEFQSKFLEIDTSFLSDFDPLDPVHIADRKYHHLSKEDRTSLARSLQQNRCIRTLKFVRSHLVTGLAKYFVNQGWLPSHLANTIVDQCIPSHRKRLTTSQTPNPNDSQLHNHHAQAFHKSPSSTKPPISTLASIQPIVSLSDLASHPSNHMKNHSTPIVVSLPRKRKLPHHKNPQP